MSKCFNNTNSSDSDKDTTITSVSSDENYDQSNNLELTGEILKNYNIICELGRGSYSIVWLAYNISDTKFYAVKVQNPEEYEDGLNEIKFVAKLPKEPNVFTNLIDYFVENNNGKRYLCSVWNLHCSNVDGLIRKGDYELGFKLEQVKSIMKQLITAVGVLHNKFKVYHGDIKTDNILVKGINDKDEFIINKYYENNFFEKYTEAKKQFWEKSGKNIKNIDNMKKEDKHKIRRDIHNEITTKILDEYSQSDISKYSINEKYLDSIKISLGDYGTHCDEHDYHKYSFGTRYYQAPEIILQSSCSYPVDIWAIGCTFYELLSGKLLFDPNKDTKRSRDYYHLCLINDTCGKFPTKIFKKSKNYKNFFNSKYELKEHHNEEDRLKRKVDELNIDSENKKIIYDILKNTLNIDQNKRITIDELIKHPFFC